jgi:hypothetical protein
MGGAKMREPEGGFSTPELASMFGRLNGGIGAKSVAGMGKSQRTGWVIIATVSTAVWILL